jgi:sugar/nucleoside kinase (ribokinase family)
LLTGQRFVAITLELGSTRLDFGIWWWRRSLSSELRVVTLGDAVMDVIVKPSRPIVDDDDVPAQIDLVAGGQAANVAAWCAYLGAHATVVSVVGADPAGQMVRGMLDAHGVTLVGPAPGDGSTGVIVSLVGANGSRTMLSDRGISATLSASDLEPRWFNDCDWLHLSGYALLGPALGAGAAVAAAEMVRATRGQISVDLSAATLVSGLGPAEVRRRVYDTGAQVVFANQAEAVAAGDLEVPTTVIKRGASGCTVVEGRVRRDIGVGRRTLAVRDTTGAGDAFAAGWLVGGIETATAAALECISRRGAMPPRRSSAPE